MSIDQSSESILRSVITVSHEIVFSIAKKMEWFSKGMGMEAKNM